MGASEPTSLFDTASSWRDQPAIAFTALLASELFQRTNRSSAPLPAGHTLRRNSVSVYLVMFERYVRHLGLYSATVDTATKTQVTSFFEDELQGVSKETFGRYLRLLERVYEHLVATGVTGGNPVTDWVQSKLSEGLAPVPRLARAARPDFVSAAQVGQLQDWLYTRGIRALAADQWRDGRDLALAALSLGSGMRFTELAALKLKQVKHWPHGPEYERFEFEIPGWASVATARAHRTTAASMSVQLFEAWWLYRWDAAGRGGRRPTGELVFPSTLRGTRLDKTTLYRNLSAFAAEAVEEGALDGTSRWVLERGAQGLRRAYVLTELTTGAQAALLTERLGHWHARSMRRYEEQLRERRVASTEVEEAR